MAVDDKRRRELGEQLYTDLRDVVLMADVDEKDQELVAALAAHCVAGAKIAGQAVAHGTQQFVTGGVP